MKKILLITSLLFPSIGISQTARPIQGLLGIKLGSSKKKVIAVVKVKKDS